LKKEAAVPAERTIWSTTFFQEFWTSEHIYLYILLLIHVVAHLFLLDCLRLLLALHSLHPDLFFGRKLDSNKRVPKSKGFSLDHPLACVLTGEPV
jgi:hypothetical protein